MLLEAGRGTGNRGVHLDHRTGGLGGLRGNPVAWYQDQCSFHKSCEHDSLTRCSAVKRIAWLAALLLLGVPPCQAKLIEISVEVTEVNNQKANDLGIQWLNSLQIHEGQIPGIFAIGQLQRLTPFSADLAFLVSKGAAELLANPKLVTDAGSPATFRAGGEIPYIASGSLGSTNVDFKAFGVTLQILPQLTSEGDIRVNIRAGVSSIDSTSGTTLSGNTVPGLLEREVSSLVTVKSGTTITLAGLVQKKREKTSQGVPVLSWIPIVGRLFSHEKWQDTKTTLVIFVTPRVMEEGV